MKFAYADPPYIGQAAKHYGCAEIDHANLIARLIEQYPDGWALSLSAKSLQYVLSLCPNDVRVLVWVKRLHGFLAGVRIQYCWEPVIMRGGRQGPHITGETTLRDWIEAPPPGSLSTFRPQAENHVIGRKPDAFCLWLFNCLGAQHGDTLDDLFPGSGTVTECWKQFQAQEVLSF